MTKDMLHVLINSYVYDNVEERREDMPVRRNWTDPTTGVKYGYDWGFDLSKGPSNIKHSYDIPYKFGKCVKCINHGTYRCDLCGADTKYFVEKSIDTNKKEYNKMFKYPIYPKYSIPPIKDVIFNDPATIVFWEDGTKTVVKVMEGDEFDPYTGLAQAISKKILGDDYRKVFKKWTKPYYKKKAEEERAALEAKTEMLKMQTAFDEAISTITKTFRKDED